MGIGRGTATEMTNVIEVSHKNNSILGYTRHVYRVVMPDGLTMSERERAEALTLLLEAKFRNDTRADAIAIFAFSTREQERIGAFDVGRIVASRSGSRGWTGKGRMMDASDVDDATAVIDLAAPLLTKTRSVRRVQFSRGRSR